jgi:hypothetical protein
LKATVYSGSVGSITTVPVGYLGHLDFILALAVIPTDIQRTGDVLVADGRGATIRVGIRLGWRTFVLTALFKELLSKTHSSCLKGITPTDYEMPKNPRDFLSSFDGS